MRDTVLDEPVVESTKPPSVEDDGLTAHLEWVRLRMRYIGDHDNARRYLTLQWPGDLPTPKNMTEMAHVERAIPLLDEIEARFGLGFVERPTALQSTGPRQRKGK